MEEPSGRDGGDVGPTAIERDRRGRAYLVRYGIMHRVGRFVSDLGGLERGRAVVVRSPRGTELGEVLLELPGAAATGPEWGASRVLRAAGPDDFERARRAGEERSGRFDRCAALFRDGVWPIELIDVEPLLDEGRTVLYYLGPHDLDVAGLRAIVRESIGLEVALEPVGRDAPAWPEADEPEDAAGVGCGSCGSGGGGCGSGGCSTGAGEHGGCSDCGVKKLLSARRTTAAS